MTTVRLSGPPTARRDRRILAVVAGLLVGLFAAVGPVLLIPPTYQAEAQVFVATRTDAANSNEQLLQGGRFAVDRVTSYAALAASPRVLDPVARRLDPASTSDDLAGRVTAVVPADTVLIDLRVRGGTPEGAAALTDAVAAQLVQVIEDLEKPQGDLPSPVEATVLRASTPPVEPLWPKPGVTVIHGLVAGLVVAAVVAALLRRLDIVVRGEQDSGRVTGLPVLATVEDPPGHGPQDDYAQLGTNLRFSFVDDEPRVVMVTGAAGEVDTASVAGCLARHLRLVGSRVCLVDGHLRRPSVHALFGLPGDVGLTSVLAGAATVQDVVRTTEDGLDVITGGPVPPNPAELLASDRMSELLRELARGYDRVVVDSAPVLAVADAAALAGRADAVLYLLRDGRTTHDQVGRALAALRRVDARVLGVVLVTGRPARGLVSDRPRRHTGARHRRPSVAPPAR